MALCKGQHLTRLWLTSSLRCRAPRSHSPRYGVLDFSPLAFKTLGFQHSSSLLECLGSGHQCKGSQWDKVSIIKMCKKMKKKFPFLDLYIRRPISVCIFLWKEPEKGHCVVGWLWFSCFRKLIILNMSSTHAVLHRVEKYDVVLCTWRTEALMATLR